MKREILAHVFCEFCEIFTNTFFTEHLWTTASVIRMSMTKSKSMMETLHKLVILWWLVET